MSDDIKPEKAESARPNANYNLSAANNAGKDEDGKLIFHYSRERRLAKAPQAVKDLYVEHKFNRFNLLKPLVTGKPHATLFFTIVLLCAVILVFSITGYFDTSYTLEGNRIAVKGTSYDGTVIMLVRKTAGKKSVSYTGAVDIAVSPAIKSEDEDYPVFYHKVFFSQEDEEEYRFVLPFDSQELVVVMQTEKSTLKFKMKPE
ncbi:MAG: hypothetical protein LBB81_03975 [Treponema sp.]|jgi:hypothetical protein|nr:hypothetical protein [Treponema sp.]